MPRVEQLDSCERPPVRMRNLFKRYQKCGMEEIDVDANIIDTNRALNEFGDQLKHHPESYVGDRDSAFQAFLSRPADERGEEKSVSTPAYEVMNIPGLHILPGLLPPHIQLALLSRLLHRDLSNPHHQTNIHLHHDISYPPISSSVSGRSFFSLDKFIAFSPKDPAVHKPITIAEFLEKRLRWMTLGGQYDWTAKEYQKGEPPPFPADMKQLLNSLFPDTDAQAAIVNVYSAGNTLSIHRDVSESCDQGLISISIGCDGLFVVGNQDGTETATLRLRTGDALYMTGSSRFAWHGVPRIIPNTCPDWLGKWPAGDDHAQYDNWRGWMYNKRININVRQMRQISSSC